MTIDFPLAELRQALIDDGVECVIRRGAQGKGARMFADSGYHRGCQAVCQHHTGSSGNNAAGDISYIDGRGGTDPGFVVSNAYTSRSGVVTLIASRPTYTEGKGGPLGIIPASGGNTVCFSNEIGGGLGPAFTNPQARAAMYLGFHATRIAARIWGWPDDPNGPTRHFAHFEWAPGRKVDPMGATDGYDWATSYTMWDMDKFRADTRALAKPTPKPPSGDDDMTALPVPERAYDSRPGKAEQDEVDPKLKAANDSVRKAPFGMGEQRRIVIGENCTEVFVRVTVIGTKPGYIAISGEGGVRGFPVVNVDSGGVAGGGVPVATPDSAIYLWSSHGSVNVTVDVFARKK